MTSKNNLYRLAGFTTLMLGAAMMTWGACGTTQLIGNYAVGAQYNIVGTLDDGSGNGTIVTKFWLMGKSGDFNSGTLPTMYQVLPWTGDSMFVWSDWGDGGVIGDCPSRTERTVFLYSIQNGGQGQFIPMSVGLNTYNWAWDFDAIANGNGPYGPNSQVPLDIPTFISADASGYGTGLLTLNLTWPALANLKGFYDVEPASNLITGVAIRYYQGTAAPANFRTADWNLAGVVSFGVNGTDPGRATVQVADAPGMHTYVALTVLFDGGQPGGFTETAFVGAAKQVPAANEVVTFKSVSAIAITPRTVEVRWTAVNEGSVASYQVWGTNNLKGQFRPVSQPVLPAKGSYTVRCSFQQANYFQVRATMTGGSVVASDIVRVAIVKALK